MFVKTMDTTRFSTVYFFIVTIDSKGVPMKAYKMRGSFLIYISSVEFWIYLHIGTTDSYDQLKKDNGKGGLTYFFF